MPRKFRPHHYTTTSLNIGSGEAERIHALMLLMPNPDHTIQMLEYKKAIFFKCSIAQFWRAPMNCIVSVTHLLPAGCLEHGSKEAVQLNKVSSAYIYVGGTQI